MSYDDFCRLSIEQFDHVCRQWHEVEDSRQRQHWERIRMLATITVQPHSKKRLHPRTLLPLPWDGRSSAANKAPLPPREQRRKRFEQLMKTMG